MSTSSCRREYGGKRGGKKKREREWGIVREKQGKEVGECHVELAGLGSGRYLKGGWMWKWRDRKGYTSSVKAGRTSREGL